MIGLSVLSFHVIPRKSEDLVRLHGTGQRKKNMLPMDLSLDGWENDVSIPENELVRQAVFRSR